MEGSLGVCLVVVNALIADSKNRSVIGCVIMSLLISPLPVFLYLLAVPVNKER